MKTEFPMAPKNIRSLALLTALAVVTSLQASAKGGGGTVGNGGGAWVCRNHDAARSIRSVKLVDLFETEHVWYLDVRESNASIDKQLNAALNRIEVANPDFASKLGPFMKETLARWPENVNGKGKGRLEIVDDALFVKRPDEDVECPGGELTYGQVVNFSEEYGIQVDSRLERGLSKTGKAALRLHEAVYAMLRRYEWNPNSGVRPNSIKARKIVSHVFSTEDPMSYSNILTMQPFNTPPAPPSYIYPTQGTYTTQARTEYNQGFAPATLWYESATGTLTVDEPGETYTDRNYFKCSIGTSRTNCYGNSTGARGHTMIWISKTSFYWTSQHGIFMYSLL